jgi:hypothetical protein
MMKSAPRLRFLWSINVFVRRDTKNYFRGSSAEKRPEHTHQEFYKVTLHQGYKTLS